MAAPNLTGFAAELYDRLGPWTEPDEANEYALAILAKALGAPWRDVDEVAVPTGDQSLSWGKLLNVDVTPEWALPWLAMWAGVKLSGPFTDDGQKRQRIRAHDVTNRGTVAGLRSAVQATLEGTKAVNVYERDSSAYHLQVVVYDSETPDPVAAEAAARSMKAAGLVMTFVVAPGWTISAMEAAYSGQTITDLEGDYASLADLEANLP